MQVHDLEKDFLEILEDEAHHMTKVLRLKEGTKVGLFDGKGSKAEGIIRQINANKVVIELCNKRVSNTEPSVEVTLYQSLPKKDKFELIIQKATELGVTSIVPIITKRTIVNIEGEKAKKRLERWEKIAQEACKQSKRGLIPSICEPQSFSDIIDTINDKLILFPYEGENYKGIKQVLQEKRSQEVFKIGIFIGPEGGWEKDEVAMAESKGAIPVSLGPRILRTETASIATLTIVLYELGDLGGKSVE